MLHLGRSCKSLMKIVYIESKHGFIKGGVRGVVLDKIAAI